jgi:hypothetical protein
VTNAGSNGKFLGVLDFDVKNGKIADFRYKLLPVFANLLPADKDMQALIDKVRAPYLAKLNEKLAVTEGLLYRRGNFNGTLGPAHPRRLMEVKDAEIAFSPGFRWGTSLLPGAGDHLMEHLLDQTAITYPWTTVTEMSGEMIKTVLEDVCDNLFNPDPYYQQGGDMVRVGGLQYTCDPNRRWAAASRTCAQGQADRGRQDLQGRRLGAGVGRGEEGRAGLGRRGALPARHQDRQAGQAQPACRRSSEVQNRPLPDAAAGLRHEEGQPERRRLLRRPHPRRSHVRRLAERRRRAGPLRRAPGNHERLGRQAPHVQAGAEPGLRPRKSSAA